MRFSLLLGLTLLLAPLMANAAPATSSAPAPSPNECVPNGSFEGLDAKGQVQFWGRGNHFEVSEGNRSLRIDDHTSAKMEWECPDTILWDTPYVLSYKVKANVTAGGGGQGMRLCLWTRLPDQHEPPGGPKYTPTWSGNFDWKTMEYRFVMPKGTTRFIIFFENRVGKVTGTSWIDDISIHPVDDRPLNLDKNAPSYGLQSRPQLTWIWSTPGFRGHSEHMGTDLNKVVPHEEALFRRTFTCPTQISKPQILFSGDDSATVTLNGKLVGKNDTWQDITRFPLEKIIKPGANELQVKVVNDIGLAGLIARLEWTNADGTTTVVPSNASWECSTDNGKTWTPAHAIAVPVPAPTQFHWAYPHLPKLTYPLTYTLPANVTAARIAVRSPGSFSLSADDNQLLTAASSGNIIKSTLDAKVVSSAKRLTLTFEDICQPPAGQAVLQLQINDQWQNVTLSTFQTPDQKAPQPLSILYPEKTWPINIAAFEAAASRPLPDKVGHLEPWAAAVLKNSMPIFQIGTDDGSSAEFAPLLSPETQGAPASAPATKPVPTFTLPLANVASFPRGLEAKLCPEISISFNVPTVPANGAALVLDVEDADAMVSTVGCFMNGTLVGMPQIIGYDQIPGGRLTNRAWLVTIPPERLQAGTNTLTLRLLPSYYHSDLNAPQNQAEEYINALQLRSRTENPYPTATWLHWDHLALHALAQPISTPINGRPITFGTNLGYIHFKGIKPWQDFVLRDLAYLGLTYTNAPIRYGVWDVNQLHSLTQPAEGQPEGITAGDYQLSHMRAMGLRPFFLFEPGRALASLDQLPTSNEAEVLRRYGKYVDILEIGNEVDHPHFGFDAFKMAAAYATIQKQSVCGQALKQFAPHLQLVGEGWYHAWDFNVLDAQQRQETPNDPGFTEFLSAHDYGKSYIIPAVTYFLLYGTNPPKPIWITECGSWTPNDADIHDFELNLRGNMAYASYIVQYLLHPYDKEMRQFSLLSDLKADAKILEKARCYRRFVHAYSLAGKPLAWRYANPAAMNNRLVFVNPVETEQAYKISFVNFSHEKQPLDVTVTLSSSGTFHATRYGDGPSVEAGTTQATLSALPNLRFSETLAPGETIEYLIPKRPVP